MQSFLPPHVSINLCLRILGMGFLSGLPMLLVLSTLNAWMKECACSTTLIGQIALTTWPYACKIFWAPWMDRWIREKPNNQRKLWAWTMGGVTLGLWIISLSTPSIHSQRLFLASTCVSLCAAVQDLILETYRAEIIQGPSQTFLAAMSNTGFRLGMLLASSGGLILACYVSWPETYQIFSLVYLVIGIIVLWSTPIKAIEPLAKLSGQDFFQQIYSQYIRAFQNLTQRMPWHHLVLLIAFFKTGDIVLNALSSVFLMDIGYSKHDIASIAKGVGLISMMCGGWIAGYWAPLWSWKRSLMMGSVGHILAISTFIVQSFYGVHYGLLMGVMVTENLLCGFSASLFFG